MASGSEQVINWNFMESDVQYIESVNIYQSQDSGETWDVLIEGDPLQSSYQFNVDTTNTISFYNKFKVEVVDKGNEDGTYYEVHEDITDHLIIIANNELENSYRKGYHIVSSPLQIDNPSSDIDFNTSGDYSLFGNTDYGLTGVDDTAFENGKGYEFL